MRNPYRFVTYHVRDIGRCEFAVDASVSGDTPDKIIDYRCNRWFPAEPIIERPVYRGRIAGRHGVTSAQAEQHSAQGHIGGDGSYHGFPPLDVEHGACTLGTHILFFLTSREKEWMDG